MKMVYDVVPFLNFTCTFNVPGSVLWEEMEFSLGRIGQTNGGYLQFSGMTVTYDPDAAAGSRVTSIQVGGTEVDKGAAYVLATTDYVATGGDGNTILKDYTIYMNSGLDTVLMDRISDLGTITDATIEGGRLIAV